MTRRRNPAWYKPFFCAGCERQHGADVFRTELKGQLYCERTYYHAAGFGPFRTPKTTLVWSSLAEWLQCANQLMQRRVSQRRNNAIAHHWDALPCSVLERCTCKTTLQEFVRLFTDSTFEQPTRGRREVLNKLQLVKTAKNLIACIEQP